jgi:hypothetical protein
MTMSRSVIIRAAGRRRRRSVAPHTEVAHVLSCGGEVSCTRTHVAPVCMMSLAMVMASSCDVRAIAESISRCRNVRPAMGRLWSFTLAALVMCLRGWLRPAW